MSKRTTDWQDKLLSKYRLPKDKRKTSILSKSQVSKILKDDETVYNRRRSANTE